MIMHVKERQRRETMITVGETGGKPYPKQTALQGLNKLRFCSTPAGLSVGVALSAGSTRVCDTRFTDGYHCRVSAGFHCFHLFHLFHCLI